MNGALVDTTADASGAYSSPTHVNIGYGTTEEDVPLAHFFESWFYGSVDEAAVWTRALSADEIATLYTAGAEGGVGAGYVFTSDGAGGRSWQPPTVEVTF